MQQLIYPSRDFRVRRKDDKLQIFDVVRKKFVHLTPEEWVRQHVLHYLIEELHYPGGLIRSESGLKYNRLSKRSDIVVYRNDATAFLLVECKASHVEITQKSVDQLSVYNQVLKSQYLAVTNGLLQYIAEVDYGAKSYRWLPEFPAYTK